MSSEVKVRVLPDCDFDHEEAVPAEYDFKTMYGPWANGCAVHWKKFRASAQLGTGHGQHLVVKN